MREALLSPALIVSSVHPIRPSFVDFSYNRMNRRCRSLRLSIRLLLLFRFYSIKNDNRECFWEGWMDGPSDPSDHLQCLPSLW